MIHKHALQLNEKNKWKKDVVFTEKELHRASAERKEPSDHYSSAG